ncbi:MAG: thioredoxin [Lentisphaeria bacterium]|nr:thioredoxin [Lentisphaeria bacterium]NQZ67092.1 thioredoxin [Lentisphaeria bacterium]
MSIELTEANFEEKTASGLVLVDFWAPWCGPCKMLGPIIDELSNEIPDVTFAKVNTDTEQKLAVDFGIRSIPAVYILKDGEVVDQFIGLKQKEEIIQIIDKNK